MLRAMKFTLGFAIALAVVGCSSSSGPAGPSAAVLPAGPIPTVTGLSIHVGSTGGGTWIKIIGTDLQRGASVTFGNATVFSDSYAYDPRDEPNTSLLITTPAHPAGVVDVIVTNPYGQAVRLSAGYEFAEPQSFDFNRNWSGVTVDGTDTFMEFVVRNNLLVSAACAGTSRPQSSSRQTLSMEASQPKLLTAFACQVRSFLARNRQGRCQRQAASATPFGKPPR
jgi:hypothetical protein